MAFRLYIVIFCWLVIYTANAKEAPKISSPNFADAIIEKSNLLNPKGGSKYEKKKESFKASAGKAKEAIVKFGNNDKIAEGISGVGDGLTQLVGGISSGSWQDMLLGGLSIVGTLASLAGPMGAALSTILSLVSMVFGLFGGSQEAEESQEGMLKRVIDEALTRARADELRAEAEGLKKAISSIRNSINQFREENSITENQATELYNQAFRGLTFFGLLKFQIDKYCDCAVDSPNDKKKISKAKENSDRCLEFLNLYADLSILRQLLIADMASLVGSVGLNGTATNLLSLTEKEKISDKEIFLFLLDPINNKDKRFCIAQYFGVPGKYPTLQAYLASLTQASTGEIASKQVVICSEKQLLGLCYKLKPKSYNENELLKWAGTIKSIYVSDGLVVNGYSSDKLKGASYGPFPGATVIGLTPGSWKSIKIIPLTEIKKRVRVCEKEKLSQDGRCDELAINDYPDLKMVSGADGDILTVDGLQCIFPFKYGETTYKKCANDGEKYWCATAVDDKLAYKKWGKCAFPQTWSDKILSISIPENVKVWLYTEEDYKGTTYGPFYGANTIDEVCGGATTKSMKVSNTHMKSSEMVKICRGPSFSQMCDFIETKLYPKLLIHGCLWSSEENKIKSMRVPGGLAVYMWTDENYKGIPLGPYIGPVSVSVVDGGDPSESQIKSLKIVEYKPAAVDSVKRKFSKGKSYETDSN
ncbi:uncharacterized protein LOC100209967 isoform X1 [Hydra vulgaris]|uniref:uncharacterized protein LOC100209967 isoform X1 n=1 Tax=Hydra vulgaris TaxID=6087 RepID=UPI001F5FE66F|nr:uncharacterized protein LOC100209967 [Hydra vulgaris]